MKIFTIFSKVHGKFEVLLDNKDFDLISSMGKWNISMLRNTPYVQKRIKKDTVIQMARFLMKAKTGEYVDHINHNTLDNQHKNLRITTNAANLRNGSIRKNNTSGVNGVRFQENRGKWEAGIKVNYKRISLGRFKTKNDAIQARREAEIKYFSI